MSVPPPPNNPTAATTVKPTYDPGWNDPPMLAYSTAGATSSGTAAAPKPKLLNKRIAFPIQSNSTTPTPVQTSDAGLPMPFARVPHQPPPPLGFAAAPPAAAPAGGPPQLPPQCVPSALSVDPVGPSPSGLVASASEPSAEDLCIQTMLRLRHILTEINLEHERKCELEKRLALLSNAWMEQHLDVRLQQRIRDLSLALETSDRLNDAAELHRSLAVDYGAVSAPWAASLRQLIIARQQQESSNHDQLSFAEEPVVADVLLDTNSDAVVPNRAAVVAAAAAFVPGQVHHI